MIEMYQEFWMHVEKHVTPEPINEADLAKLYPPQTGLELEAAIEVADMCRESKELNTEIKKIEKERVPLMLS